MADLNDVAALATSAYWDDHYAKSDGNNPTHEWLQSWKDLRPFLSKHFLDVRLPESSPHILHLGSGDSTIPADLAALGYKNQLCLDFSPAAVKLMQGRHAEIEGIEWRLGDLRQMDGIAAQSFDLAFDKCTLDAMIYGNPWSPPDEVKDNVAKYMKEVYRVLKDHGIFLCISFRQPHFIKRVLPSDGSWNIEIEALGGKGSFGYFACTLRKIIA